jgi:hypothetical protein
MYWALLKEDDVQDIICRDFLDKVSTIPARYRKTDVMIADLKIEIAKVDWSIAARMEELRWRMFSPDECPDKTEVTAEDEAWMDEMVEKYGTADGKQEYQQGRFWISTDTTYMQTLLFAMYRIAVPEFDTIPELLLPGKRPLEFCDYFDENTVEGWLDTVPRTLRRLYKEKKSKMA